MSAPSKSFSMFRDRLSTGDFVMENRIEDVNRDLAIGNGAGAWQKTRVLYANLPDLILGDVQKDFEHMKDTIDQLITSSKSNMNSSKQSPYVAYIHKGKDINTTVCDLLLEWMQLFNKSADKHNFRWTQKGARSPGLSTMSTVLNVNGNGHA